MVVGVDVEPHALAAEVVRHGHPERVAVEVAHRLELAREHVDVPELARPEPGQRRRGLTDVGEGIARRVRQQLDAVALGIVQVQVIALVALVRHAVRLEMGGRIVGRAAVAQLEPGVVVPGLASRRPSSSE